MSMRRVDSLPGDPRTRAVHLGSFGSIDHFQPRASLLFFAMVLCSFFVPTGPDRFRHSGIGQGPFGSRLGRSNPASFASSEPPPESNPGEPELRAARATRAPILTQC